MGVDYHTYVGPYVRVRNVPKPSVEEYHSCTNPKCKKYEERMSAKFCPDCGNKIGLIQVPSTERISSWELIEEMDEKLSIAASEYKPEGMDDFEFFIPNIKYGLKRNSHFNPYCETYAVNFDWKSVSGETELFSEKFKKEIEFLREKFGDEHVAVLWGVIGYTS